VHSQWRDLTAYSRAAVLGDDLPRAIAGWPRFDRWSTGMQLLRAADSIGANIAEAAGREHAADKRRFLVIARASLFETEHGLRAPRRAPASASASASYKNAEPRFTRFS
jgi:four helix bundle protein